MHREVKDVHHVSLFLICIDKEEIRSGSKFPTSLLFFLEEKELSSFYQPQYAPSYHIKLFSMHIRFTSIPNKQNKKPKTFTTHLPICPFIPHILPLLTIHFLYKLPLYIQANFRFRIHPLYKLLSTFFPYNQQTNHPPKLQMGVSISKSNAYVDMQRKAQQRAASRSKESYLKNSVKATMEGKRLGKENEKQGRTSQLAKSILVKHPIESLAQSSHKIPERHSHIYDHKQLMMQQEFPESTANNRKILNSLKRSLQMPEQSPNEDEHNHSPTEEFTKEETSKRKTSNHPSCYTIHTKKKIDFGGNPDFAARACQSGKSIESQARDREIAHLPSGKMMADDPFSNPNEWRTYEDSPQVDMRFIGPKSIILSNKFAQMDSQLQEKRACQTECKVVTMKVIIGSRRSRVT